MTESHATEPAGPTTPSGLSPSRPGAPRRGRARPGRPEPARPEPIDWEAKVLELAARSRPHRQKQAEARERRDRILSEQRAERRRAANRSRSLEQVPPATGNATADHPAVAEWVERILRGGSASPRGWCSTAPPAAARPGRPTGRGTPSPSRPAAAPSPSPSPRSWTASGPAATPVASLDEVEGAELLLLDDLAAERASDWTIGAGLPAHRRPVERVPADHRHRQRPRRWAARQARGPRGVPAQRARPDRVLARGRAGPPHHRLTYPGV
jgi:hypothetical protein